MSLAPRIQSLRDKEEEIKRLRQQAKADRQPPAIALADRAAVAACVRDLKNLLLYVNADVTDGDDGWRWVCLRSYQTTWVALKVAGQRLLDGCLRNNVLAGFELRWINARIAGTTGDQWDQGTTECDHGVAGVHGCSLRPFWPTTGVVGSEGSFGQAMRGAMHKPRHRGGASL